MSPEFPPYKVALNILTLGEKPEMVWILPPGIVDTSERLLIATNAVGAGSIHWSCSAWMIRVYEAFDYKPSQKSLLAWSGLDYTVRTGKPGFDHVFGMPAFEWMEENPEKRAILDAGQGLKAAGLAEAAIEAYDFSDFGSICDVGGGNGTFLTTLLSNYSHIKGFVADLPRAVISADKVIGEAVLQHRCKAIPHDFLKEAPPICNAFFLVNVLHDWEDEICCKILKNISKSMHTEATLLIVEYILEPGQGFSVAKLLDIEVLVMGGGRERSIDEYITILGSVGMAVTNVIPTKSGAALIECKMKE